MCKSWLDAETFAAPRAEAWAADARIDNKLSGIKTGLGGMNEKLTAIATTLSTLQPFIQDLVKREMDKAASPPQKELQQDLPNLGHTVSVARNEHIEVDVKVVQSVGRKLSMLLGQDRTIPQIWSVSANLASYRSSLGNAAPAERNLPDCYNSEPLSRSNVDDI